MRKKEDSGKYILENNLRTWSELKRERLAALMEKEGTNASPIVNDKEKEKERKVEVGKDIPTRKRWGGCPNGCDHGKHNFRKENSMHAMQLNGKTSPAPSPIISNGESDVRLPFRRTPTARRWQSSSEEDEDDPRGRPGPPVHLIQGLDVQKSLNEVVSSPDGTPSFISVEDRLRSRLKSPNNLFLSAGRDFGGSVSGAGSDTEFSQEEDARKRLAKNVGNKLRKDFKQREMSGMARSGRKWCSWNVSSSDTSPPLNSTF